MNMIKKISFLALIITLSFSTIGHAQSNKTYVDSMAKVFLDHSVSSCIVIGIIDHGQKHIYCYGNISKTDDIPANDTTIFEIGSITKLFTATAAAEEKHMGK